MDKLNDIWKNRFNEGEMPVAEWNTPDEELWGNILPHVPKKKKKRKWFLFFLIGLLGLVVTSVFIFKSNAKEVEGDPIYRSSLDSTNSRSEYAITTTNNNQETIKPFVNKRPTLESTLSLVEGPVSKKNQIKKEKVQILNKSSKDKVAIKNSTPPKPKNKELFIEKSIKPDSKQVVVNQEKERNFKMSAPMLPVLVFTPNEKLNNWELNVQIDPKKPKSNLPKINFKSGFVYWQHNISNQYKDDLSPFDFNYSDDLGWFAGVETELALNNYLSISAGLQYEQITTASGHNSNLQYDKNAENTESANDYSLSLATPYGLSAASFRFDRDADLNEDQVDLLVDFNSAHTIRNLNLPIGLKYYPLGKHKRIIPSINVGLGVNYLVEITNAIDGINTNHDAIHFSDTGSSVFQNPDLNKWFVDAKVGLGLDYKITTGLQFSVSADWTKGLNPIFLQDQYNTKINRYYLSIGLAKTIGK